MKKAMILCSALLVLAACKKEEKTDTTITETVTDTVVTEVAPPPPADVVEDADGTSVSVNSDGVSVDSKDGGNKTTVNVSKDNAEVEIKK